MTTTFCSTMNGTSYSLEGILIQVLIAAVLGIWWWKDYRITTCPNTPANAAGASSEQTAETTASGALPGTTPCPTPFLILAVIGALAFTFLETAGELLLGISAEQKNIPALFLCAMLGAAVTEEIVFRGFLVLPGKGRAPLLASALVASLVFALLHDFLWAYSAPSGADWWEFWRGFSFTPSLKNFYSTATVFVVSLYFYTLRFHPSNPQRSLLPCFAAHAARNLAVFLIKLAQGHICGLW